MNSIKEAESYNPWFTKENIENALNYWSKKLNIKTLEDWISKYEMKSNNSKVAIIMAGNFPLAGFHDLISVFISGNTALVKPSSDDKILISFFINFLKTNYPKTNNLIQISQGKLIEFDKVIATGSNNTFNYFEYYFRNKKSILRKNRNSLAVLDGNESKQQIKHLSKDIFQYFGLGCRNVSKIFIPYDYNLKILSEGFKHIEEIINNNNKYCNNYNYYKTIKIMNNEKFIDNQFYLLEESKEFSPPISVIYYEFYDRINDVIKIINENDENIQCVVSNCDIKNKIDFGNTQNPKLSDYSDNIDTLEFLLTK